jgi:hypothetical protein
LKILTRNIEMLAAAAKQTEGKIDKYVDSFAKQVEGLE